MKLLIFKWLRRFSVVIATKLFIFALLLTVLRLFFLSVEDYKEEFTEWVASEYNFNISTANISASIDFSGLILVFNDIELADSEDLPFLVTSDSVFIHLDFWDSLVERKLNFKRVSLKGVDLTVKSTIQAKSQPEKPMLTLDSLQTIFLQQLTQFSITDSQIHFQSHLGEDKTIVIEQLSWLNEGEAHQGVGSALLPESLGENSLEFIVNISGQQNDKDNPLQGDLYVEADQLNITDYLIDRVNPDAKVINAVVGFQMWSTFSLTQLHQAQIVLNDSQLVWSQSGEEHSWLLNNGVFQLTNKDKQWLLDSYDLDVEHNQNKLEGLKVNGSGTDKSASFDFSALTVKDLLPLYLLDSNLPESQISLLQRLDIDAEIQHLDIKKDVDNRLQFATHLQGFKNRPQGAIPGISNGDIELRGDTSQGQINITLPKQKIYFDDQFSREMPVKFGDITVNWLKTPEGFKVFSEQSLLQTSDLDSMTEFSILFPNKEAKNQSPFLSLYSYASLNDASKAKYYYPVKALKKVYDYLEPTLKKGKVKGAKILWYGALNQYPYKQLDGIFQAWIPLRDAQYDFYGNWQGLRELDVDLLFHNDGLTMNALQASLGEAKLQKLSANIDHLNSNGMITINADVNEDAQKVSEYLKKSPLKESVGQALSVINLDKKLSGHLQINIPFNQQKQKAETLGEVTLLNNDLDLKLSENLVLPLKNVQGKFNFINGNFSAKKIDAQLFGEDLHLSFDSVQKKKTYQVKVDIDSVWDLQRLNARYPELEVLQLSGNLDWTGDVYFTHYLTGGFENSVSLHSATQGVTINLPAPFKKNALQEWPIDVLLTSDQNSSTLKFNIQDKLDLVGALDHQSEQPEIPYFAVNIGSEKLTYVDKSKHLVSAQLDTLNLTEWYKLWLQVDQLGGLERNEAFPVIEVDQVLADINHATLFEQPFSSFNLNAINDKQKWRAEIASDNLTASAEYRTGEPSRWDFDISNLNFKKMNLSVLNEGGSSLKSQLMEQSDNLQVVYPEIFANCKTCIYGDYNLSPMKLHIYPNKNLLNIDYMDVGTKKESTLISGFWDQRRTNLSINSHSVDNNDIVKRFGFTSPVIADSAKLNATINWLGAPWQFNVDSLNGEFSTALKAGSITEVNDQGARLLSLLSLNAIRNTLNLQFNNIFEKGFNFDDLVLSGKISEGIIKNDDFFLDGSAGKIVGKGVIDLPNYETNYLFSYSPAVTSSLPVLTAFAINPLTGAAVLFLTKILEPVVETIIRVDYSVTGSLDDPVVKFIGSEKGKVKLQNSEVLDEINRMQHEGKEESND